MTQHPITPPPELAARWVNEIYGDDGFGFDVPLHPITLRLVERAAQWGADQELEACCEWLHWQNLATHPELIPSLRAARRSKPPSLKEQALLALNKLPPNRDCGVAHDTIRRALEQLPE